MIRDGGKFQSIPKESEGREFEGWRHFRFATLPAGQNGNKVILFQQEN